MSKISRKAVITGSSKGIGKAIAERFAQENIDIYLLASNEKNLQKTTSELKSKFKVNVYYHASDLKTKSGCKSAIKAIENEFTDFDTLIFSAGATKSGDFLEQPIEDFEDGFALKFYSAVRLSKAFWPTLSKNKGWIVSINGAMSHSPDPFFMVGGAVNAAFLNFSKALSKKGLSDGVNVNSINPGMTLSAIWKALAVTFAISLGVLICSTCFAMSENVFTKSISCKCILPVLILFTCPINRTIGTPP
jgi:short-subunit dehydrogenase